jgi:stage II sporulation protein P
MNIFFLQKENLKTNIVPDVCKYWGLSTVNKYKLFIGLGIISAALSLPVLFSNTNDEHRVGNTCTIKDEEGCLVTKISRRVRVGDEVITSEGKSYQVQKVDGNFATARFKGMDKEILAYSQLFSKMVLPAAAANRIDRPVAIYHTHSDESYLPTDGSASIPFRGGILQVGDSYTNTLSREGTRVLHDKTPHDPHDDNAYYRSRRTAFQLLKKNPIALFDIHRDGVDDPQFYRKFIFDEEVAQIRIVVGRQNPNMGANLDFAKRLMTYANKLYWPVVKEIFVGHGNYNQDLMSTTILLEAGTYTNSKEEAMKGIDRLADAVPVVLGITGPPSRPGAPEYEKPVTDPTARRSGVWAALAWIVVITLIGGGAFVLINAGDLNEAKRTLLNFLKMEWAGGLGPLIKKIPIKDKILKRFRKKP